MDVVASTAVVSARLDRLHRCVTRIWLGDRRVFWRRTSLRGRYEEAVGWMVRSSIRVQLVFKTMISAEY